MMGGGAAAGYMDPAKYFFLEIEDVHFASSGHIPCLDPSGSLICAMASAVKFALDRADLRLVVYGHTDTTGTADSNLQLSIRRARAMKALLAKDPQEWASLTENALPIEVQTTFKSIAACSQWNCDPGSLDGVLGAKTASAIEAFQMKFNRQYQGGANCRWCRWAQDLGSY